MTDRPIKSPPPRLRQRRRAGGWRIWWEPETALRELGFEPVLLDARRLTWSVREAARLNDLVDQARGGGSRRAPAPGARGQSISALIHAYRASPRWERLKPDSQKDYATAFRTIETKWGSTLVADFTKPIVFEWYETLYRHNGRWAAAGLIRKLSLLMSYAELRGWRQDNPCLRIGMHIPKGRSRVASWAELDAILAAAAALDLPSMGCAVALAVFQGQRQKDIREARVTDFAADVWKFQRSKRGNHGALTIHPYVLPWLARIVAAAGEREVLLHYEGTDRPYSPDLFHHVFSRVRALAARSQPTLHNLQFRDLRRTFGHLARQAGIHERAVADALGNNAWKDPNLSGTYMPATFESASSAVRAIKRPDEKE